MVRWMFAVTTPQTKQLLSSGIDVQEHLEGVKAR